MPLLNVISTELVLDHCWKVGKLRECETGTETVKDASKSGWPVALPGKANISEEKEETYLKGTRFMALQKAVCISQTLDIVFWRVFWKYEKCLPDVDSIYWQITPDKF